jgi:hypothetical protein
VANGNDEYNKYMRILDITLRTCATMLSIVFAYTLAGQSMTILLRVWVTLVVVFLTITILFSGFGIIFGDKNEPKTLKRLAYISFIMMMCLIVGMLILLLFSVWHS